MKKSKEVVVSWLLIVSILLSMIPSTVVLATESEKTKNTNVLVETATGETTSSTTHLSENASVVKEDVTLRGKYEKHFLMSDGSYQVALYNEPVHKVEGGEWVEIDNTLSLQTTSYGSAQYATVNGLADVSFAQSFEDQLVTMRKDNYSVSWGVQAVSDGLSAISATTSAELVQPVRAELITPKLSTLSVEEQKTIAVKSSSAIQYRNALRQNVDLEYVVLPSRVKENIVLQSAQDITYYVVTVHTENLSARLLENREIEFYNDSGEVVFTMTSPYMYDRTGELSENITVEMTSKGSGCYLIKMIPDAQWLGDESRVYPVVIDPQVSADTNISNIIDNYVLEGAGVQNRNLDRLYIGNRSTGLTRAFIQYAEMPTLPAGSTITAATMTLSLTSGTGTAANASAYMVTGGEWTSGTIQWSNMPAASTALATNISHNNLTGYTFSCKTAVQAWYNGDPTGQNANYGIMLRYYDENVADYNAVYSADYTDESKRPILTITYQGNSVSIIEGYTRTLSVTGATGTITWASSNTDVATVDSSGTVTGIKAGRATITAYVGGSAYQTFIVYVKISDGVYYIKNGSSLCLGTSGGITDGTTTWLFAEATSGRAQLNQLWKIAYLDNGYYSIRPLYKLDMALCSADGVQGNVEIATIGTSDTFSSVPGIHRWTIEYNSSGYLFCCAGTTYLTMQGSMPYPGASVVTKNYSASESGFIWDVEKVTTIPNQVLLLDAQSGTSLDNAVRYVEVGDTITLADMGIATSFVCTYSLDQSITWSTINPSIVSVNSSTGEITGVTSGGTATIIAKHMHNGVAYEKYYKVCVICPDPLDPSKIEYMRQTRITGTNLTGGNTDHSIIVIKSLCSADPFFTAIDHVNGDVSRTYVINSELKNQLNTLEAGYQDGFNAIPLFDKSTDNEKAAHAAKGETDQLVNTGKFTSGSDEYYGVWAYNYVSLLNLADMWGSIIDTATKAYDMYLSITAFYYSWLATSNTNVVYISQTQYDDIAAYIDDFDNAAYNIDFSDISFISAEERNIALASQGYTNPLPYKDGTPVLTGKVSNCSSDVYVRVFKENVTTQEGRWFMRYSDIYGLTPEQIQAKFALSETPTHYSFVTVPEGKTIYVGVVNESSIEGTIQFEILERAEIDWYGVIIELIS